MATGSLILPPEWKVAVAAGKWVDDFRTRSGLPPGICRHTFLLPERLDLPVKSIDLTMESSSSLNCWVYDVLALCRKINDAVVDKKAHVNEQQCFYVKFLADFIQRYVKQWIAVCGEGAWWNFTEQVGKELFRVLDSGLQLVILCCENDVSALALVTFGFKGELSEIIDDARIYVQMINRFILHSLHSSHKHRSVVEKLIFEVELDCYNLHSYLKIAHQQDKNTLINSPKSQPTVPMSSLLPMLKTVEPNISDSDLSEKQYLGYGSFAVVNRAKWHKIPVAVKNFIIDEDLKDELTIFQRLLRFDSPHIVRMLGYSAGRNLVLELMDKDLEKQITGQESPLPLIQSLDLMLQIAKAMRHLHNIDVVHRDLKPANILLQSRKDGSLLIKLSDFGISKASFKTASTHTDMRGTLMYMAPEMVDGEGKYSRKVDIYSFGLICKEILTGKIRQSRKQELTLPIEIPKKLGNLIHTCIELNDAKRPSFEDICDILWLVKEEVLTKVTVDREARELKFTISGLEGMRIIYPLSCNQDINANPQQEISCHNRFGTQTEVRRILPPIMPTFTGKRAIYVLTLESIREGWYSVRDLPIDNLVDILLLDSSLLLASGELKIEDRCTLNYAYEGIGVDLQNQRHENHSPEEVGIFGQFKKLLTDQEKKFNLYLHVGGWNNSECFSAVFSTATTRNTFVSSILGLLKSYPIFNGLVIDWQYISDNGKNYGKAGNITSKADVDSLVLTLEALRKELPVGSFMIALTSQSDAANQWPIEKAIHLLDQVHMLYPIRYINKSGHRSALYSSKQHSIDEAVKMYHDLYHDVPASKIFIRGSIISIKYGETDGIGMPAGSWEWSYAYKDLPVAGSEEKWDDEAKVSYAHDPIRRVIHIYDSDKSMVEKAKYIKEKDLGGIVVFFAECDFPYNHECSVMKALHDHLTHG